jgi:hypothetical protein
VNQCPHVRLDRRDQQLQLRGDLRIGRRPSIADTALGGPT